MLSVRADDKFFSVPWLAPILKVIPTPQKIKDTREKLEEVHPSHPYVNVVMVVFSQCCFGMS